MRLVGGGYSQHFSKLERWGILGMGTGMKGERDAEVMIQ